MERSVVRVFIGTAFPCPRSLVHPRKLATCFSLYEYSMGVFVLSIAPPWFSYTNLTNKYSFLPCFAIYGILSIPFLVLRGLLCSNPCIHFASSDFLSCTHVTVFHTRLLYSCPQLLSLGSSTLTFRTLSAGCLYYRSCLPTFP